MEQLDISLNKGVRRTPSFAENGELSECVNLYPKNGELRNIPVMTTLKDGQNVFVFPSAAYRFLALHQMDDHKAYISLMTSSGHTRLYYTLQEGQACVTYQIAEGPDVDADTKVQIVGNIIMAYSSSSLHYYLYKTGTYKYLGDQLPELPMTFGINGEMVEICNFDSQDECYEMNEFSGTTLPSGVQNGLYNYFSGKIQEFEAEQAKKGRFTHPFFVRYALRLYDGTYYHHSTPVLMMVSDREPLLPVRTYGTSKLRVGLWMIGAELKYKIEEGAKEVLENWKDLIKGVDIFVSAPICYHDINEKFTECAWIDNFQVPAGYTISKLANMNSGRISSENFENNYQRRGMVENMLLALSPLYDLMTMSFVGIVKPPLRADEYIKSDMEAAGPFYRIKSYSIAELEEGDFASIELPSDRLPNLATQTILSDDYFSHDKWGLDDMFVYNSRVHLTGVRITPSLPMPLSSMIAYGDKYQNIYIENTHGYVVHSGTDIPAYSYKARVKIERNDGTYVVDNADVAYSLDNCTKLNLLYVFYPDPDAKTVWLYRDDSGTTKGFKLNLTLCDSLNGAFYWCGIDITDAPDETTITDLPTVTANEAPSAMNKIYQSNVENPFVMNALTTYTVGSGRILKIAANTEPLSPSQYGQFPLITFSTDGMWAQEINDDGTMKDPKPVSGEVLSNLDSVISVDGGLLYITNQGLKMISANKERRLLSGTLEGKNIDEDMYVGSSTPIYPYVGAWATRGLFAADTSEVREALQTAKMVYDSKNNLVHIFFTDAAKQTVLNLNGLEFTEQVETAGPTAAPSNVIISAPYTLMQFADDAHLYVYDGELRQTKDYGFCLSRILSFGQAEQYANVMQMKVYHDADTMTGASGSTPTNSMVKTALYVSNDKIHWALLTSLKGASYKYYRFALFTYMTDLDAVSGLSFLYNPARTNKLR